MNEIMQKLKAKITNFCKMQALLMDIDGEEILPKLAKYKKNSENKNIIVFTLDSLLRVW